MKKIGLIYFDVEYLIPHFVGIASELYKNFEDVEVEIIVPEMKHDYLFKKMTQLGLPHKMVKKLPTYSYKKIAYKLQGRTRPNEKYIFKKNIEYFKQFDVLAFVVFNHHYLLDTKEKGTKFVYLKHGSGDSPHPYLPQHKPILEQFDLVIASGEKILNRFEKMGEFKNTSFKICGYPKLDVIDLQNKKNFFKNEHPVILYNPHFNPEYSSFFSWGDKVLDFFLQHKEYNLIFAPHMRLFDKRYRNAFDANKLFKKYGKAENILLDLGSIHSVDMSYTSSADIYLGDISSQVYEFLLMGLKPVIYLNSLKKDWRSNNFYNHWKFGKVIDEIIDLKITLETASEWHKTYREKQKQALVHTFDISKEKSSSLRVAEALYNL